MGTIHSTKYYCAYYIPPQKGSMCEIIKGEEGNRVVVMPLTSRTRIPYFYLTQAHACRPDCNSSAVFPAISFCPPETCHFLPGCGHRGGRGAQSTVNGEESPRNMQQGAGMEDATVPYVPGR